MSTDWGSQNIRPFEPIRIIHPKKKRRRRKEERERESN
jgi:hypothetical protein